MNRRGPSDFVPDRGDIVWLDLSPVAGHEQGGRRPALVISPAAYNGRTGLALMCPVTSQVKGYPFEVALPADGRVQGVVLSDMVRSLDWRKRRAEPAAIAPSAIVADVLAKLSTLVG